MTMWIMTSALIILMHRGFNKELDKLQLSFTNLKKRICYNKCFYRNFRGTVRYKPHIVLYNLSIGALI